MAVTNRWAVRDVATASFFDIETGKLKVKIDTLKMSNIENTAETVYAVGGSGNPKLVGFSGGRSARFVLQDALFSNEMLGMLLGNEVTSSAKNVIKNEVCVVSGDAATLTYTPASSEALVSVNLLHADGTVGTAFEYVASAPASNSYTLSGKTVSFASGEIPDQSKIIVYYETAASPDTKEIRASSDKFAGSFKLVLDVLVRDYHLQKDYAAQITVENAKIEDNWNLNMQPDGEPSPLDIPMEALKPADSHDLYVMRIYDEKDLA